MNFPLSFQEQIELLSERLEREGDIQAVELLRQIDNALDEAYERGYNRAEMKEADAFYAREIGNRSK